MSQHEADLATTKKGPTNCRVALIGIVRFVEREGKRVSQRRLPGSKPKRQSTMVDDEVCCQGHRVVIVVVVVLRTRRECGARKKAGEGSKNGLPYYLAAVKMWRKCH